MITENELKINRLFKLSLKETKETMELNEFKEYQSLLREVNENPDLHNIFLQRVKVFLENK